MATSRLALCDSRSAANLLVPEVWPISEDRKPCLGKTPLTVELLCAAVRRRYACSFAGYQEESLQLDPRGLRKAQRREHVLLQASPGDQSSQCHVTDGHDVETVGPDHVNRVFALQRSHHVVPVWSDHFVCEPFAIDWPVINFRDDTRYDATKLHSLPTQPASGNPNQRYRYWRRPRVAERPTLADPQQSDPSVCGSLRWTWFVKRLFSCAA